MHSAVREVMRMMRMLMMAHSRESAGSGRSNRSELKANRRVWMILSLPPRHLFDACLVPLIRGLSKLN